LPDEIDAIGSGHRDMIRVRVNDNAPPDRWLLGNLDLPDALKKLEAVGITGLSQTSSRADVIRIMGAPDEERGERRGHGERLAKPWIKYRLPECQVHFTFFGSRKLSRIAFLPRDWQPGM
jgi:hypothetical protein